MNEVFVSYKREDQPRVAEIVKALEESGFSVWWDHSLSGGTSWREQIQIALDAAKCVIVVWTHESIGPAGDFVRDEASHAKRRRVLVPVLLDKVSPPLGFMEIQAIDLSNWDKNSRDPSFKKLCGAVTTKLNDCPLLPGIVPKIDLSSVAQPRRVEELLKQPDKVQPHRQKQSKASNLDDMTGSRITIERERDLFRFSAVTRQAVIPVREIAVQSSYAEGAAEFLKESRNLVDQYKYGKLFHNYLMPEDFQDMIDMTPLTLMVDRSAAAFPWEMAAFERHGKVIFYGPGRQLTRQFRTTLSDPPGLIAPPIPNRLRVLVIADPAPETDLQLPGARAEGRAVVQILESMREKEGLDITIEQRIGADECDPVELLALILSEEFDLIHYSGHGDFDEKSPAKSGWIFGKEHVLSARDIFRARRVPRLIFANACFSGVLRSGRPFTLQESNRNLAGLAQAFFERGIQNYIGTGWPVNDASALEFTKVFYREALSGDELGSSLSKAREAILTSGSTWGAYQHYGQATAKLMVLSERTSGAKSSPLPKRQRSR